MSVQRPETQSLWGANSRNQCQCSAKALTAARDHHPAGQPWRLSLGPPSLIPLPVFVAPYSSEQQPQSQDVGGRGLTRVATPADVGADFREGDEDSNFSDFSVGKCKWGLSKWGLKVVVHICPRFHLIPWTSSLNCLSCKEAFHCMPPTFSLKTPFFH